MLCGADACLFTGFGTLSGITAEVNGSAPRCTVRVEATSTVVGSVTSVAVLGHRIILSQVLQSLDMLMGEAYAGSKTVSTK